MESKDPLVSVIIPTYNNGHLISYAIDSIIRQTYQNWEIIVVDNTSTDQTLELLAEYTKKVNLRYFTIQNEGVIAKSRNHGIKQASGEFIAFLDSDDWWEPQKLKESISVLKSGNDLVYHDLWEAKTHTMGKFKRKVKTRELKSPIFVDLLLNGNGIINSSVVVRKAIVEKTGLISENKSDVAWEDFEYWLRISTVTEKFSRIKDCLGNYWVGGGNVSNPNKTLTILKEILLRFQSQYRDFGKRNLYPSWIYYGILTSQIETKQIRFGDIQVMWAKLNLKHKLLILIKILFNALKSN
ncbi:glycosyltransferase family 2 protein [Leptospira paudalimensis]|uniref:Glycosyltransferase n=1 Tax=Leptospira paudalimensis TaxID=2950024 RepID=A0ABT3M5S4_9LEPT|nr:glycosyltransferase [Leptospira paudalimensis]MCW7503741.1 glycosyltransferase [Leptospira paudalimensis]